ncbi:PAS-domain containing protein [Thalassotalea maritima]|uniref:PAS domain-containing hybrid sensor histidine kinase/response regulator n=1 Tax=Thalassotalea maritima TaxID=3242416 RepID=UPI0035298A57
MLAWQSINTWFVTLLSVCYLLVLFIVAYWGQKQSKLSHKPWVYSLALGVSCSSWAFYGTVGQAASTGEWLAPIYIGSIFCFVIGWPMLLKTLHIIKKQNLTSIADFIACRYDKSPYIAGIVTIVALIGIIPYISLQLRAIGSSFDLLTGTYQQGVSTSLVVTLVLIVFSILFGARQLSASKQSPGLVLAIAFSSVVKLFALTAVGIFATFFVFDGFSDLINQHHQLNNNWQQSSSYFALSQAILGAITIFILPQQFHMMMIENQSERQLKTARWLFPLYLIAINVFILPIAIAGQLNFPGGSVNPDSFVLSLPLFYQHAWLGALVYIGGLAAATSMVVVAAIVLSTMITTEVLTPILLKLRFAEEKASGQLSTTLLNLRRGAIAGTLILAFAFERVVGGNSHLASIGLISFVLLSQFAPALIGALYWRKATYKAALVSILAGACVWLYTLLLPLLQPDMSWVNHGPWQVAWLKPNALFGISKLDDISHGLLFSLLVNLVCFVVISLLSKRSVSEKLQAELFINKKHRQLERHLTPKDLYLLLQRFIDKQAADDLLIYAKQQQLTTKQQHQQLIDYTRLQLSGVLGSASTRMVMRAASSAEDVPLDEVASIVDEASQVLQFNRELLQSGVENIDQGISVIDADMRLVAWNRKYIELLDYPADFIVAGIPVSELLRFNINRGIIVGDNPETLIDKRIAHMRAGKNHYIQRLMPNGRVLEIRGQAMPGGGFVSTFSDITQHIEAEKALQQANETLEKRVASRTEELQRAKAEAEAANRSKTRFLAAASHDLMQPFNALTLFTDMLKAKVKDQELRKLANNIDDSLNVVEALLSDLVEISRLDNAKYQATPSTFAINELLTPLKNEFSLLAKQANIEFHFVLSQCHVHSDQRLLRRIIQNFLSNAVHYCQDSNNPLGKTAKILFGVRRQGHQLRIEVWDNGPGIAEDKLQLIFAEFERLPQTREIPGLGLGLAISERIAKILGLRISVRSSLGKGTVFAINVPLAHDKPKSLALAPATHSDTEVNKPNDPLNITALILDNDPLMLTALSSQLEQWGCQVLSASNPQVIERHVEQINQPPSIIVADYHLDDAQNGVDVFRQLLAEQGWHVPCVICSADPSEQVREHTSSAHFHFLRKPIKPLALKRLIKQVVAANVK